MFMSSENKNYFNALFSIRMDFIFSFLIALIKPINTMLKRNGEEDIQKAKRYMNAQFH